MSTMQELCDRARIPLQDAAKTRYSDADLLAFGVAGLLVLLDKRPDLYFGQFGTISATLDALALGSDFPLGRQYFQPVADYTTARARSRSAEEVVRSQAQAFFNLFEMTGIK